MSDEEKKSEEKKIEEKKIIVDEDWKSQVEAEREAAQKQKEAGAEGPEEKGSEPEGPEPEGTEEKGAAETASGESAEPLPPPSLGYLCGSLYFQAMIALGVVPNSVSEKAEVDFELAQHAIETLAMLQEKTEGNRTEEESEDMERMLHELRMGFVGMQQQGKTE